MKYLLMMICLLSFSLVHAAVWDASNDPAIFDSNFDYRLNAFEVKAYLSAAKTPWSETYWPENKGSINYRWNAKTPVGFDYVSPSREQVLLMSRDELAVLSPAEKYDLVMGHYDYPLKKEVAAGTSKTAKYWAGICNGWSTAALQYAEPLPVDVMNPDGVMIPFGTSDVKGLLSYYHAFDANIEVSQVGKRCFKMAEILGLPACQDINPGAMHVILTNQIAGKHEGFVAEVDPGSEIWNQPVFGYEYEVLGSAPTHRSPNAVRVKMKLEYADELDQSSWEPVNGTKKFQKGERIYEYILELDLQGKITGGEWISKDHPDFFWKANNAPDFKGSFEGLKQIYKFK